MSIKGFSPEEVAAAKRQKEERAKQWLHWSQAWVTPSPSMTATEVAARQAAQQQEHDRKLQQIGAYYGFGHPNQKIYSGPYPAPSPPDLRAAYAKVWSFISGGTITDAYREAQRSIPREGIRAGEITAYRTWRVSTSDTLRSTVKDNEWLPDEPMVGDVEQGAGVFCFRGMYAAQAMAYYNSIDEIRVVGSVEIWGDIVEHEYGYRAQFAAVKTLDTLFFNRQEQDFTLLARLQAKYQKEPTQCQTSKPSSSASTSAPSKPKPESPNWRQGTSSP